MPDDHNILVVRHLWHCKNKVLPKAMLFSNKNQKSMTTCFEIIEIFSRAPKQRKTKIARKSPKTSTSLYLSVSFVLPCKRLALWYHFGSCGEISMLWVVQFLQIFRNCACCVRIYSSVPVCHKNSSKIEAYA